MVFFSSLKLLTNHNTMRNLLYTPQAFSYDRNIRHHRYIDLDAIFPMAFHHLNKWSKMPSYFRLKDPLVQRFHDSSL